PTKTPEEPYFLYRSLGEIGFGNSWRLCFQPCGGPGQESCEANSWLKARRESQDIGDLSRRLSSVPEQSLRFQEVACLKALKVSEISDFSELSLGYVDASQQGALAYAQRP